MKKVYVFSNVDPSKAYSCLIYLSQALCKAGLHNKLYAKFKPEYALRNSSLNCQYRSFYDGLVGRIPKVRNIWMHLYVLFISLYSRSPIIYHEITFFPQLILRKKFRPECVSIHYATELFDEIDEPGMWFSLYLYKKYANLPDLIIDVNHERAQYRRENFSISKPTLVIRNSVPSCTSQILDSNILENCSADTFRLVYSGAAYAHRALEPFIDACMKLSVKSEIVMVLYGPKSEVEKLSARATERLGDRVKIYKNLDRESVLKIVAGCNVSYVYYNPELSIGNRYAEPTKFYEALSLGVSVVCSRNESLLKFFEYDDVGVTVETNDRAGLEAALQFAEINFPESPERRQKLINKFDEEISYYAINKSSLEQLLEFLK